MRKAQCQLIYKAAERKTTKPKPPTRDLSNIIATYTTLADRLIDLCIKEVDKGVTVSNN
jgi:hypothetical protein